MVGRWFGEPPEPSEENPLAERDTKASDQVLSTGSIFSRVGMVLPGTSPDDLHAAKRASSRDKRRAKVREKNQTVKKRPR
jgi:hypothetical protein